MIAYLLLSLAQDEDPRTWIERLGDRSIEVREEAENRLVKLGAKALPLLEKAANAADPEIAERARRAIDRIRARQRAIELGLDTKIPATLQAARPSILERAGADAFADRQRLTEELLADVDAGKLAVRDVGWIGVLVRDEADGPTGTSLADRAARWWQRGTDAATRQAGRAILADLGAALLADWSRILLQFVEPTNDADPRTYGIAIASLEEMGEAGGPEVVPSLLKVARSRGGPAEVRKAAIKAIGRVRQRHVK